jgi:hypothetical protein
MVGHVHGYERQWPVFNNTVTSKDYNNPNGGVPHIVNGSGGNIEGLVFNFEMQNSIWHAKHYLDDEGYGILRATQDGNDEVLQWKFYSATDNKEQDEIIIQKPSVKL